METIIINKELLIELGYPHSTAQSIIRQAKALMVQKGYPFYHNKRLGRVPREAVEVVIGARIRN